MVEPSYFSHLNITSMKSDSKGELIFIDEPLKSKNITLHPTNEKPIYQAKYLRNTGLLTVQDEYLSLQKTCRSKSERILQNLEI